MGVRKHTENYGLTTYQTSRGLPTYLEDTTDSMEIIDQVLKNHDGRIIDNADGIVDLQNQIDNLDVESIRDYKSRLDALETKVKTQSILLAENSRHDNEQDVQISSNTARIEVLENRVAVTERDIADLRTELNSTNLNVSTLEGRVTTLENRCDVIEHEIQDLKNDIIGISEDMVDLAHQFEATAELLVNKQDKLVAGTGIRIEGNVISATGQGGGVIGQYDSTTENLTLG